jgi:hypothetical protein
MRNNHTRKSESFQKFSAIFKVALIFLNYFACLQCVPRPTPKGEKERGAAGRRTTLFLSLFCRRRRQALAEEYDF